jgi:hypothetical protein
VVPWVWVPVPNTHPTLIRTLLISHWKQCTHTHTHPHSLSKAFWFVQDRELWDLAYQETGARLLAGLKPVCLQLDFKLDVRCSSLLCKQKAKSTFFLSKQRPCFVWQNIDLWGRGPRTTEGTVMNGHQIEDSFFV